MSMEKFFIFIDSEEFTFILLYIIVLPIVPPLFLSPYYLISPTYSSLPPNVLSC